MDEPLVKLAAALREIATARAVPAPKAPDVDWYLFTVYLQELARQALKEFDRGGDR